jgi:hypothetical protein
MGSYHWSKKLEATACVEPPRFNYKGLTFPKYHGRLSRDELRSGYIFYAFFGGKPMTRKAIEYQVDQMIDRGLIAAA